MWLVATISDSADLESGLVLGGGIFESLFEIGFQKKSIRRNVRCNGFMIVVTSM